MTSVAVIGLGRIAVGVGSDAAHSHIGCIRHTPGMSLAAVVDPEAAARDAFRARWPDTHARVLGDIEELGVGEADIIVLCTPASVRLPIAIQALERQPKLLVVEKPLASSSAEAQAIINEASSRGVELRVNFHRRFDPRHGALKALLQDVPRHVILRYGKGLLNYGTHLIDLLLDWWGPALSVQALASASLEGDPALTFNVRMRSGFDALVVGFDGLDYDQFEVDLFFIDRRIEIASGGVQIRRYDVIQDRFYRGYPQLGDGAPVGVDAPIGGFPEFYRALRAHFSDGARLSGCDGSQALAGLMVIEAACRSARSGGRLIALS